VEDIKQPSCLHMTEMLIKALTRAHMGHADPWEQSVYRETLRELVVLAKTEKMLEVKLDTLAAMGIKDDARQILDQVLLKSMDSLNRLWGDPGAADGA
jgi:hypothetical protein